MLEFFVAICLTILQLSLMIAMAFAAWVLFLAVVKAICWLLSWLYNKWTDNKVDFEQQSVEWYEGLFGEFTQKVAGVKDWLNKEEPRQKELAL